MLNNKMTVIAICMVLIAVVGCSKTNDHAIAGSEEKKNHRSAAIVKNGTLYYDKFSTLYKEIDSGVVPLSEEFKELKLEEINNGVARFSRHLEGNNYEWLDFVITPEIQKQLDDAGVYYHTVGTVLYEEYLSTITFEAIKSVYIEDLNEAEEAVELVNYIKESLPGDDIVSVNGLNYITKIVDINKVDHNLTSEDLEVKVYDTIEKIDEGIRNGDFDKQGSNFFMGSYKIINQNTILAVRRNNSNITKEFSITPYIAEKLKNAADKSFDLWYKEFDGKDYIIDVTKK